MGLHGTVVVCAILVVYVSANNPEWKLVNDILRRSGKIGPVVRPVANYSDTINVRYGLALLNIQDFDEDSQVVKITAWERYSWKDNTLKWNPKAYGGLDHTRLPPTAIWRPDIVLYNQFNPGTSEHRDNCLAVMSWSGDVLWIPPNTFQVYCPSGTNGTYDCTFKFGSWTYDGFKVDIDFYDNLDNIDPTDFIQNHKWEIVSHSAAKNVKYYPCCEEPYPSLAFRIAIAKK